MHLANDLMPNGFKQVYNFYIEVINHIEKV